MAPHAQIIRMASINRTVMIITHKIISGHKMEPFDACINTFIKSPQQCLRYNSRVGSTTMRLSDKENRSVRMFIANYFDKLIILEITHIMSFSTFHMGINFGSYITHWQPPYLLDRQSC